MSYSPSPPERHRALKLIFVPLLIFSLFAQCAVVWTQLDDIRGGYFDFELYYSGAKILNDGNGAGKRSSTRWLAPIFPANS